MPNHIACAVPAGTAVCFDTSTWHTGMPNTGTQERRGVIMGWRSSQTKTPGHACGLRGATLQRLESEGKLPLLRRRLMGLPDAGLPQRRLERLWRLALLERFWRLAHVRHKDIARARLGL